MSVEHVGLWRRLWLSLVGRKTIAQGVAMASSGSDRDQPNKAACLIAPPPALVAPLRTVEISTLAAVTPTLHAGAAHAPLARRPAANFMLAARLASAASLNPPKSRRQCQRSRAKPQAAKVTVKAATRMRAKPIATERAVKASAPARHVWLSGQSGVQLSVQSSGQSKRKAEIVSLIPLAPRQPSLQRAA